MGPRARLGRFRRDPARGAASPIACTSLPLPLPSGPTTRPAPDGVDLARARAVLRGVDERLLRAIAAVASDLLARPSATHADALVVETERVTFAGRSLTLGARSPTRRILDGLVAARGEPLDVPCLFALGWPRERVSLHAARNRVHVALATLRRGLLEEHLERGRRGYALAPELVVDVRLSA